MCSAFFDLKNACDTLKIIASWVIYVKLLFRRKPAMLIWFARQKKEVHYVQTYNFRML